MDTSIRLLKAAADIWAGYHTHPFVEGIKYGTLDIRKFRHYMIQDYWYLMDYTKVFGIGVAKSKSVETMKLFAKYIQAILAGEVNVHNGYMADLGISQEELCSTPISQDNRSYTSYMLRAAYDGGEAEILTAILSCAYSYEVIAKNIVKNNPESIHDEFYGDWVKSYTSEAYAEENVILLNELNRLTETYTEKQIQHLIDIFVACSRYELAFWEMSWTLSQ